MTVKQLKELLIEAPDDMRVYVASITELGMFAFEEACEGDSGIITLGPLPEDDGIHTEGDKIFSLMPHGLGIHEDELNEEGSEPLPPEVLN